MPKPLLRLFDVASLFTLHLKSSYSVTLALFPVGASSSYNWPLPAQDDFCLLSPPGIQELVSQLQHHCRHQSGVWKRVRSLQPGQMGRSEAKAKEPGTFTEEAGAQPQ